MGRLTLNFTLARPGFELAVREQVALEEITAVYGPSAAGKTTLLRVIAGLEDDARGLVEFEGVVWQGGERRVPAHKRRIGYVFQDGRLFAHLTVEGNLRFALRHAERRARDARAPIELAAVVKELDLAPLLARRVASLSGGEQQRVAIGRALLTSPRLLLMDEPLSSLDVGRKREIAPLIARLPRTFGVPVLYVTHNVDEVARLATDMLLLDAGRIVASGRVADVLARLDIDDLGGTLDAGAVLHVRVEAARGGSAALRLNEQFLHVPTPRATIGAPLRIRIHARDVAIAIERPRGLSIRNVLQARIVRVDVDEPAHADVLLEIDGQHLRARITRDALEELKLAAGQPVFALIKSVALETASLF